MEQTDSCQRERMGGWMKEGEGISQRTCVHNLQKRQQCGDGQKEGGRWVEVGTGGENRDKVKKRITVEYLADSY